MTGAAGHADRAGGGVEEAQWLGRPISSAVERLPYKQDVAGSKPASGMPFENLGVSG